jgi:tRNA(Ile)-lysidine synthetase-like protein
MIAMIEQKIIWPKAGKYVLAVSGGADSMTLLQIMASAEAERHYDLIVAHFDHGIRQESAEDMHFVKETSTSYNLDFVSEKENLVGASEATARIHRFQWLEAVMSSCGADAIITAHHLDDLLETSLLNLARGSGRRGLAPMLHGPVQRPLLLLSRQDLRDYAKSHKIAWREDKTNSDITNPRNYLRHKLLPSASTSWRASYLENITKLDTLNKEIDQSLSTLMDSFRTGDQAYSFPRIFVRDLSLQELEELLMAAALSLDPSIELNKRLISELALFAKTGRPGTMRPMSQKLFTGVQTDSVRVYYMGIQGRR